MFALIWRRWRHSGRPLRLDDITRMTPHSSAFQSSQADLPMLATYETIDLGILRQTTQAVRPAAADLESSNFPVLVSDPSREEALYVYHALGVHSIDLSRLANTVTRAMRTAAENDDGLLFDSNAGGAIVAPLVSTVIADR
jgi:nucleoporin NUP82